MQIPEWAKFTDNEKPPPGYSAIAKEIIGPLDLIPPYHQNLMTREDWAAEPPYRPKPRLRHPIQYMKLTFTTNSRRCANTRQCLRTVLWIQRSHVNQVGIDDIQYNFMIGGDAKVYEGRGWHFAPENGEEVLEPWENRFIDIAFIGDFKGYKVPPSRAMMKAAWQLIQHGIEQKFISENYKVL